MAKSPDPPEDDFFEGSEISDAVRDAIERKVAAYATRRNNAKTPAQYRNSLLSQAENRYVDLPAKLADGGDPGAIEDIVLRLVGRTDSHYHYAIHMFNVQAHMDAQKNREIAEAVARVQSTNNERLHGHIDKLTGVLSGMAAHLGLPPPPKAPPAIPAPDNDPDKPEGPDGSGE